MLLLLPLLLLLLLLLFWSAHLCERARKRLLFLSCFTFSPIAFPLFGVQLFVFYTEGASPGRQLAPWLSRTAIVDRRKAFKPKGAKGSLVAALLKEVRVLRHPEGVGAGAVGLGTDPAPLTTTRLTEARGYHGALAVNDDPFDAIDSLRSHNAFVARLTDFTFNVRGTATATRPGREVVLRP